MKTASLSFLGILVFLHQLFVLQAFIDPYFKYAQLDLPPNSFSPDSVVLDKDGNGPYVAISDGRILKYVDSIGFVDFAYLSPNRDIVQGKPFPPRQTGRLIEYNIATGTRRVLSKGLPLPVGPALSKDGKFIVYSSRNKNQVFKYSLNKPNAGNPTVVLLRLPGYPIKTKTTPSGKFWVAVNVRKTNGTLVPYGYKFDLNGTVLLRKNLGDHYPNSQVNVLLEYRNHNGDDDPSRSELYIGSRAVRYVGKYRQ